MSIGHDSGAEEATTSRARSMIFNNVWLYGAAFLILLGMILRQRSLSLLGLLTLTTAGGAFLWAKYALGHIVYSRQLESERVFPGDRVGMRVRVQNNKLLPLAWIDIEDQVPDNLRIVERETLPSGIPGMDVLRITTAMRWYERVSWRFNVECRARGYYTFGPVVLRSGDLFGFFTRREALDNYANLTVYPRIVALDQIGIPPRHLFGELSVRRLVITDPSRAVGVREYRPEDEFRFVHWKATARAQTLQTKVFEPTTTAQFGVFLNLDTFEHYWEGVDYERAEAAIVVAASLATTALAERKTVGMFANGVVGGSDQPLRIRPGRSHQQGSQVLGGLARLNPIASVNFPKLLRAETTRFPWGSTVVVISAIMTDTIAATLAEIAREGHRLVLITLDDVQPPPIRNLLTFRVDSTTVQDPTPHRRRYAIQMNPAPLTGMGVTQESDG